METKARAFLVLGTHYVAAYNTLEAILFAQRELGLRFAWPVEVVEASLDERIYDEEAGVEYTFAEIIQANAGMVPFLLAIDFTQSGDTQDENT